MLVALNDYVLIKPDEAKKLEEGQIADIEKTHDEPVSGVVIEVGVNEITVGQRVWFKMWAGENVEDSKGVKVIAVRIKDLMAAEIEPDIPTDDHN